MFLFVYCSKKIHFQFRLLRAAFLFVAGLSHHKQISHQAIVWDCSIYLNIHSCNWAEMYDLAPISIFFVFWVSLSLGCSFWYSFRHWRVVYSWKKGIQLLIMEIFTIIYFLHTKDLYSLLTMANKLLHSFKATEVWGKSTHYFVVLELSIQEKL